jgi:RimJ/RimL family protein N-acetyltransferase
MDARDDTAIDVRPAEPDDGHALIAAIEAIDRETEWLAAPGERLAWADRPAATLAALGAGDAGVYLIARRADTIVGYLGAFAGQYRSTRGVLSIQHVGVRHAARRQGIASRLVVALEAWAGARGGHRIDLTVDVDNAPARAFYRRHGFVEEGVIHEAARDGARWRSYQALAKLLDGDHGRPLAGAPTLRQPRADRLTVRFRPVVEADAAALRDWEIALLSAPPPLLKQPDEVADPADFAAALRGLLASPLNYLVAALVDAADAERVVGLLGMSAKPQPRLQDDLAIIVNVLGDYRGLGIGRRLFAVGEDWARARGGHRLSTSLHAANDEGARFAAALGFTREVVMRRYARFGDRAVDLLGFAKLLTPG